MVLWVTLYSWLKTCSSFLRQENFPRLAVFMLLVVGVGTVGFAYFEALQPWNALWWTMVTITTVGYGDITPVTLGGRIVGVATMMAGIGLLGTLTAAIATVMVSSKLEGIRGVRTLECTDHFVICGWNFKAREILAELRADLGAEQSPVVLIADLAEQPLEAPHFFFVRGEVMPDTMTQANMHAARAVIVLGDEHVDAFSRDARTILTTLTIKTAYPHLHTCVELVDAKNRTHCQLARADEIIVSGALTSNLLVRAALDPGVTLLVSDLLSTTGHEFYLTDTPRTAVGQPFLAALQSLKRDYNVLIIALRQSNGTVLTNPASDYTIQASDRLYIIAEDRPHWSA